MASLLDINSPVRSSRLLALYSLKKRFMNRVKLIYIDPPYNTGSDEFNYNDRFNHSTWLTFMKNRLEIANELLREDGAIFVQIDHHELSYLLVLMDEIFGRDNFVQLIRSKCRQPRRLYGGCFGSGVCYLSIYSSGFLF